MKSYYFFGFPLEIYGVSAASMLLLGLILYSAYRRSRRG